MGSHFRINHLSFVVLIEIFKRNQQSQTAPVSVQDLKSTLSVNPNHIQAACQYLLREQLIEQSAHNPTQFHLTKDGWEQGKSARQYQNRSYQPNSTFSNFSVGNTP
ncbi:hypothetical protein [Pontibacter sp. G13]|uniref:hypothetical protein n=1 Tax=Pontibacter sp. G13 TaxID=3074898 RepID=UPI00288924AD|nr:hypothetical protein [Pontibacter sp. G13]WNJ16271.1 hypothetical protein RJD25_15515 [Pontibacter sp. G13]